MNNDANKSLGTASKLVSGAAILAIAAVISKLLGTIQKIPLQNIGGDEVFGIYNAVYPFYSLILFIATAGLPITVSKFVSEYTAQGQLHEARRVMRISIVLLTITGIVCAALTFMNAHVIAQLIGHAQTELAIQSVALALLFVPPMAALRGYFQGQQNMVPTAFSQVIEQVIRVGTMVVLLLYFTSLNKSVEWVAAGATFGSSTGAVAGLIVMLWYVLRDRRAGNHRVMRQASQRGLPLKTLVKKMVLFAIPVCLGAIVVPILSIVDAFTIPRMLQQAGLDASEAMLQFGVYARGLPLVQLVALLFSSLSVALVPSLAEARQQRAKAAIQQRAELSLRLTWLIGWAASFGLALMVVPLNRMLFTNDLGSMSMAILAFTAIFSSLNIIAASILQGLGTAVIPAVSLLVAAIIKVGLNMMWIPQWGIEGAAVAAVITFIIASTLNVIAIKRHISITFSFKTYIVKPMIALFIMSVALWLWLKGCEALGKTLGKALELDLQSRSLATVTSLTAVALGALVYIIALLRLGAITAKELNYIPKVGTKLVPILQRLRLLKVD